MLKGLIVKELSREQSALVHRAVKQPLLSLGDAGNSSQCRDDREGVQQGETDGCDRQFYS